METGLVFNIQRFSVHDGPGIRTTVFLKGCPLSCWWCHNPESKDTKPLVSILPERCIGCEACLEVCPNHLASPLDHVSLSGNEGSGRCARCGACAEVCPSGARTLIGKPYPVDELMRELDKDQVFYDESGGGITFSGGEPLAPKRNAEFLLACLEACRDRGHHTAVDTCGYVPRDTLLRAASLADLFLYDLKLMDDELHQRYTGVSNRLILENLMALSNAGGTVWIRVPLIPGINDDKKNLEATADFVSSLPRSHPMHLLPYHKVGGDKYRRLGETYSLNHIEPPEKQYSSTIAELLRAKGLEVRLGG
jgi:pyruvate formate lyase activating enzyme